jgi:hypothetical protein
MKLPTIAPLTTYKPYVEAVAILRTLQSGMQERDSEIDAIRTEAHLARVPRDPRAAKMRDRLASHRANKPQAPAPPSSSELPPAVAAAIELLGGVKRPRFNPAETMAQLEHEKGLLWQGIVVLEDIVKAVKEEYELQANRQMLRAWDEGLVIRFRGARAHSAGSDGLLAIRSALAAAGCSVRADVLRQTSMTSQLILGSEHKFDSEISRERRQLEEWGLL